MVEREAVRARDTESVLFNIYEEGFKREAALRQRAVAGKIVIRGKDRPWQQSRQGHTKHFMQALLEDTAFWAWSFFIHDIRTHSGKHRHQGGLCLYVIEGKGWTTFDGDKVEWEAGDLILIPIKLRGVVHQHFNAEPGAPCKWLGILYSPFKDLLGSELEQKEASPEWNGPT